MQSNATQCFTMAFNAGPPSLFGPAGPTGPISPQAMKMVSDTLQ